MTTRARHPLVEDYLRRLRTESARLPTDQARELLGDIDEHLDAALGLNASEAVVRNVLERVGTPPELVSAAGGAAAQRPVSAVAAMWCLVLAELIFFFPAIAAVFWGFGVVFVVRAIAWSPREKLVALLVLGAGFPGAFLLHVTDVFPDPYCYQGTHNGRLVADTCSGVDPSTVVTWALVLGCLSVQAFTIWRLTRSARRR